MKINRVNITLESDEIVQDVRAAQQMAERNTFIANLLSQGLKIRSVSILPTLTDGTEIDLTLKGGK